MISILFDTKLRVQSFAGTLHEAIASIRTFFLTHLLLPQLLPATSNHQYSRVEEVAGANFSRCLHLRFF